MARIYFKFEAREPHDEERKPDCALTCGGYKDSDGECVDGCDHIVWDYDVEPDDFPPGTD